MPGCQHENLACIACDEQVDPPVAETKTVEQRRYWAVEYYDNDGRLDHNTVVNGFDELASYAQGRMVKIAGESDYESWKHERATAGL